MIPGFILISLENGSRFLPKIRYIEVISGRRNE